MTALPSLSTEGVVRQAIHRLARVTPGPYEVVSCYLKLEPRDKTRGKYLIKMKNRVREALAALDREGLKHAQRESVAADLERVRHFFEEPARLPPARGIAIFACTPLALFEAIPLPHVHLVYDRTAARFFEVTAYDVTELPALVQPASRTAKFHGANEVMGRPRRKGGSAGEHNYHQRIREEKHRLYAAVADRVFQLHSERPFAGLVVAGIGVDAAALLPHLHTYLHDLVLGVVKLNRKSVTAAQVREAALTLREERERAWERAHAEAAREGLATGWAVNGIEPTLKALERGQVRTLLADGHDDDPRIDDAIEEALAQRAQVDVLYDERARRAVQGLAALLRFRR
ncbi:MAG: hypothetical protein DMD28_01785 [Gemmatimonadetes bacterium]|nr:MAG: hypothetical protein DMD28_01785 [Gemmatimonadota bacterium]